MPPKSKQLRCAYVERDQRCRRAGTGNPPLCEAHRIVIEAEVERPARPGERLAGLLGRVLRGQKINDDHLYAGIEDAMDMFQRRPSFEELRAQATERLREQARQQRQRNGHPPPPPKPAGPDPRVALGFRAGQKVTAAEVKARHRELARKHHPDRGGSVARMQEINAAVDQLLATL
jgi:hypothetical protein